MFPFDKITNALISDRSFLRADVAFTGLADLTEEQLQFRVNHDTITEKLNVMGSPQFFTSTLGILNNFKQRKNAKSDAI